jgi:hypothetical protein
MIQEKMKQIFEVLRHVKDHDNVCLVVLKNTNDHALLFKAFNDDGDYIMNSSWLMKDTNVYYEKDLSLLDRSLMSVTINNDSTIELPISVNRTCQLIFDSDNRPAILTTINEKESRLDIVYVHLNPDALEKTVLTIIGRSLDGHSVQEEITIDLSWIPTSFI